MEPNFERMFLYALAHQTLVLIAGVYVMRLGAHVMFKSGVRQEGPVIDATYETWRVKFRGPIGAFYALLGTVIVVFGLQKEFSSTFEPTPDPTTQGSVSDCPPVAPVPTPGLDATLRDTGGALITPTATGIR